MPDKNQYKPSAWQSRLESLEEVPGEPAFNKHAAWEKLSARLDEPAKKDYKMIWWFAAAAVLAGLLFMAIRINAPQNPQVQPEAHNNKPVVSPAVVLPPVKTTELIARKRATESTRPEKIITASAENKPTVLTPGDPKPVSLMPDVAVENQPDTPLLAAIPPPFQKKKMAVVYLNEIEAVPSENLTKLLAPKKKFPRYQKSIQTGTDDVFVATEPKRFTINLSSAN